jgi:hypothetical protein
MDARPNRSTEVGIELDHKPAALLDALEVPVRSELEE